MNVWYIEVWNDTASDGDSAPGWDAEGFRIMDFHGEVFTSAEACRHYIADMIGYTDVRWLRISPRRYVGRTRGNHRYHGPPDRPVYFELTRTDILDG